MKSIRSAPHSHACSESLTNGVRNHEREAKRALAAVQTPPGRFDLLECDLPAVATAVPKRPVVSSPSPKPLNPVETITDLTAARSPLELARMLAGLASSGAGCQTHFTGGFFDGL